jgi:hypothetical protein
MDPRYHIFIREESLWLRVLINMISNDYITINYQTLDVGEDKKVV